MPNTGSASHFIDSLVVLTLPADPDLGKLSALQCEVSPKPEPDLHLGGRGEPGLWGCHRMVLQAKPGLGAQKMK